MNVKKIIVSFCIKDVRYDYILAKSKIICRDQIKLVHSSTILVDISVPGSQFSGSWILVQVALGWTGGEDHMIISHAVSPPIQNA